VGQGGGRGPGEKRKRNVPCCEGKGKPLLCATKKIVKEQFHGMMKGAKQKVDEGQRKGGKSRNQLRDPKIVGTEKKKSY